MADNKMARIKELVELLNQASKAYYAENREIMSNFEYDKLYDELVKLEQETNIVLSNSPTVNVGYEAVDELPKEKHETPMLSLGKTKSREELRDWIGDKEGLLSWKLDGLTIVLTYQDGELKKAVTRGNGETGEVITNNAKTFRNIPLKISYPGELILRGEAVISYSDFARINETITDVSAKYKNPRNLCSGSVRQLNNEVTAKRNVQFFAFSLVKADNVDFENSREKQLLFLREQGFGIVEYMHVNRANMTDAIKVFEDRIQTYDIPSDGLVLAYDDYVYGKSLGMTAKFPRDSIAFKWADELRETTLKEIEWSPSRTGLINPVAIFEPVELEGTTVSRASVHNLSVMEDLALGIGDAITVYKANMIIPQIAENLTRSNNVEIPKYCPVCGGATKIRRIKEAKTLFCENPECPAKQIKAFPLFVSRAAMIMNGLSEATLEKLIDLGAVKEYADLFRLEAYRETLEKMEGFGEKSVNNLLESIEKARNTTLPRLIYALGIDNIGVANAKVLCKHFDYDIDKLREASVEELSNIDGVGEVIASSVWKYMQNQEKQEKLNRLLSEITLEVMEESGLEQNLSGMSFVITGSLNHYENRNQLKEEIEGRGGKVTGSVTGKTTCLINNDITSTSGKNKKAKELGVPVISEEEFLAKYF